MHLADDINAAAHTLPPFPMQLGVVLLEVNANRVVGEMAVTALLSNRNGVLHGGALMSFADTLAGVGAATGLLEGKSTITMESKTNFLRAVRVGEVARGTSVCLHRGQTTTLWQTTVERMDGKPAAIITQTQLMIEWRS